MRNEAGEEDELPPIILVLSSLCKEAIDTSFRYAGDHDLVMYTISTYDYFIF